MCVVSSGWRLLNHAHQLSLSPLSRFIVQAQAFYDASGQWKSMVSHPHNIIDEGRLLIHSYGAVGMRTTLIFSKLAVTQCGFGNVTFLCNFPRAFPCIYFCQSCLELLLTKNQLIPNVEFVSILDVIY